MDVGLAPRDEGHQSCNPVSSKVALCKMDLIGIGVIIFTVFFLLCCLERIVKFFKKTVWKRTRSAKKPEVSSPTQSEAPLIDYQQTMSPSPVLSTLSDNESVQIIPLHRCPERSESEPAVIQTTANNAPRPFSQEMSSISSFVSIQRPHFTSGMAIVSATVDQPTRVPTPTLIGQDAVCPQTLTLPSENSALGSPFHSSTPPPPGPAHEKSKKRPVSLIGRTRAASTVIAPEIV